MGKVAESPEFRSLEFSGTPWTRWASSFLINAGVVAGVLAIPVTVHQAIATRARIEPISLVPPAIPKPARPVLRKIPPPPAPPPAPKPKVEFKAPPVKTVEAKAVVLPPAPVEIPKPAEALKLEAPKIDLPVRVPPKQEVKLEVFQQPATPTPPAAPAAPVKAVQTGGFGESAGVSSGTSPKKVLAVGGFDSAGGAGAGPARPRVVANAGFGSFDAPAAKPAARAIAPVETPVEITFKPKPAYTPEAREKKIEGEVTLEVLFSSNGEARVIRILHGLGFGLDENARTAASQIRFHPGTRNGSPVDVTGTVHIVFELS